MSATDFIILFGFLSFSEILSSLTAAAFHQSFFIQCSPTHGLDPIVFSLLGSAISLIIFCFKSNPVASTWDGGEEEKTGLEKVNL
jgi:hypothetical protein